MMMMMMMMLCFQKKNYIAIIALCDMIENKQMLLVRSTEDKRKLQSKLEKPKSNRWLLSRVKRR